MRRRSFLGVLGGAIAFCPLAARTQQPAGVRRIGVIHGVGADDPEAQERLAVFVQTPQQSGWVDGHNLRIDVRWAGGSANNVRKEATELAALAPDAILTTGRA